MVQNLNIIQVIGHLPHFQTYKVFKTCSFQLQSLLNQAKHHQKPFFPLYGSGYYHQGGRFLAYLVLVRVVELWL